MREVRDVPRSMEGGVNECQLEEPPFYQCCCKCKHHFRITAKREHEKTIGWACGLPVRLEEEGNYVIGEWPEHSCGCECYHPVEINGGRGE